jgi:hypothetical protein
MTRSTSRTIARSITSLAAALTVLAPTVADAAVKHPTAIEAYTAMDRQLDHVAAKHGDQGRRTNRVGPRLIDNLSGNPYRHAWGATFHRCGGRGGPYMCIRPVQGDVYYNGPGRPLTVEAVHEYKLKRCIPSDGCPPVGHAGTHVMAVAASPYRHQPAR